MCVSYALVLCASLSAPAFAHQCRCVTAASVLCTNLHLPLSVPQSIPVEMATTIVPADPPTRPVSPEDTSPSVAIWTIARVLRRSSALLVATVRMQSLCSVHLVAMAAALVWPWRPAQEDVPRHSIAHQVLCTLYHVLQVAIRLGGHRSALCVQEWQGHRQCHVKMIIRVV